VSDLNENNNIIVGLESFFFGGTQDTILLLDKDNFLKVCTGLNSY